MKRHAPLLPLALFLSLVVAPVRGQDPPSPDDAAKQSPAAAKQSPAAAGAEAEQYAKTLQEWRQLLKEMRATQVAYQNAGPKEDTTEIEKKWDQLVRDGEQLTVRLRKDAVAAYLADPGKDLELVRLLLKTLQDDVAADRYEEAYETAVAMADSPGPSQPVLELAGTACFVMNDYDHAEKYFSQAAKLGPLQDAAGMYASLVPTYRKYWEEEQEARKQDADSEAPRVLLKTNRGDVEIELFENEAPGAVGNFVSLVEKKYYDGLTFHRVIPNFMAQGGCPDGTGGGGPGYEIYCECHQPNHRKHFRGSLSMAHAGRDTGGSQFFLTFVPTDHLNGKHTVFGRVVKGFDVLAKLRRRDPGSATTPDRIIEAKVLRKDEDKQYVPNRVQ